MTAEKPTVKKGAGFSGVWIIPLLALVLGAYMVVHTWLTEGPTIKIAFSTASGLESGKTKIKYRNVDMGLVEAVELSDDLKGVIATVKLNRQALPLLRADTRFWVVTARVGFSSVSGLDTLLSGAYIQLSPGEGELAATQFTALEQPPLTPIGAPGLRLKLISKDATSVSTGDSVLYKGFSVGRIESMEFMPDTGEAHYALFIDAPYHTLINSAVRFYNASGISVSAGAEGFKIQTGSLDTIFLGGVAFDLPEGVKPGVEVAHDTEFELYESEEASLQNPFRYGTYYVVQFDQSIKGLYPGAPVEFRGLPVGEVSRIMLKETIGNVDKVDREGKGDPIPVLIYLEPARMEFPDSAEAVEAVRRSIQTGVANGLRASLETGNLLTGAMYVGIDYFDNAEVASMGSFLEYGVIPAIQTGLGQLQYQLSSILNTVDNLPLEKTVTEVNSAITSVQGAVTQFEKILANEGTQRLPADIGVALRELTSVLSGLTPGSTAYESINSSLLQLNRTLNNFEAMTETLAEQPNKLVFPLDPAADPIPEAQ
ncbi:MAG: paraquat-inducible protein B [Bacteroidia bacterium]